MKALAIAAAVLAFLVAALYWIGVPPLGQHVKHGLVFAALGALALVWLRFQTAKAPTREN
jgi:hypothetical protein